MNKKVILLSVAVICVSLNAAQFFKRCAQVATVVAAGTGIKGAIIVKQNKQNQQLASANMTFQEMKNSLNNERTLWNKFSWSRGLYAPQQQPNGNTLILQTRPDGSQVRLTRDKVFFLDNDGTLSLVNATGKVLEKTRVDGPIKKSLLAMKVSAGLALSALVGGGFYAGFFWGTIFFG
jgi:hypothetical protein